MDPFVACGNVLSTPNAFWCSETLSADRVPDSRAHTSGFPGRAEGQLPAAIDRTSHSILRGAMDIFARTGGNG
jgi:hypothetical protein